MAQNNEKMAETDRIQEHGADLEALEQMLKQTYTTECVPEEINIRLNNQLACRRVMASGRVSFWWLPATISTVVSAAFAVILYLLYIIINIKGANSWMPNLLQFVSETWLKIHLTVIALETAASWIITFLGVWKGNLIRSAKLF